MMTKAAGVSPAGEHHVSARQGIPRRRRLAVVLTALAMAAGFAGTMAVTAGTALAASASISPSSGSPGTPALIEGCGFDPNSAVQLWRTGPQGTQNVATIKSDSGGCISLSYTVRRNQVPGTLTLQLTQRSGNQATTYFYVQ